MFQKFREINNFNSNNIAVIFKGFSENNPETPPNICAQVVLLKNKY